jgi:hypothetical protein
MAPALLFQVRMRKTILLSLLLTMNVAPHASGLDQIKIHEAYNNGEFDTVVTQLESFLALHKNISHDDSIFVCKHLAVVYSVSPDTREKGRYFMYKLLELMPYAQLIDMYVSDEINRIFERVRAEFYVRQKAAVVSQRTSVSDSPPPVPAVPAEKPRPMPAPPRRDWRDWILAPTGSALNIEALGGRRSGGFAGWAGLGSQPTAGLQAEWRPSRWPVSAIGRALYSQTNGSVADPAGFYRSLMLQAQTLEFGAGARLKLEYSAMLMPFVEAGLSRLTAGMRNATQSLIANRKGNVAWLGAGAQIQWRQFRLSADYIGDAYGFGPAKALRPGTTLLAAAGYGW